MTGAQCESNNDSQHLISPKKSCLWLIRDREHKVGDLSPERFILDEQFVHLRIVLQQTLHRAGHRHVVCDSCGMRCIFPYVLKCGIRSHFRRHIFAKPLDDTVGVVEQRAELLIEELVDLAALVTRITLVDLAVLLLPAQRGEGIKRNACR